MQLNSANPQNTAKPGQGDTSRSGPPDTNNSNRLLILPFAPFILPAKAITENDSMGLLKIMSIVAVGAFFGIAYIVSRYYPNKQVMKKALIGWVVLFLAFFMYYAFVKGKGNE